MAYSIADQTFERSASLGIFNTSLSLLGELARRPGISPMHVYAHPSLCGRLPPGVVAHEVNATGLCRRVHWEQWRVFSCALRDRADWLILPKGFASAVRRPPLKTAAYVHDIMAATYFDRYPAHGGRWKQRYFAQTLRHTLKCADVILTNTAFTKGEILSWATAKKISPIPRIEVVGYGLPGAKAPPPRRDHLILVDVRDWPHKRTDLAVAYLERWRRETRYDGSMICVGRPPKNINLPRDPAWQFVGRISADRYFELMSGAQAHVHFTEYEGFGLPPAEAILNGTPAVYSEIDVTREVMSGAGCPFSNADFDSFSTAMSRALGIQPAELTSWQAALTRRHNWGQTADRVLRALGLNEARRHEGIAPKRRPMRLLEIFNRYEHAGGEEAAAGQIFDLLRTRPEYEITRVVASSGDWLGPVAPARWKQALWSFSNPFFRAQLRKAQAATRADAWIVHNVFPVASAGVYAEALALEVPIIQFAHNWRPFSVNGSNFIHGEVPGGRLRSRLWREFIAASWRGSHSQTLCLGLVLLWLRKSGWLRAVRAWVAVSEFARDRLVEAGLPPDRVFALRHFWLPRPAPGGSTDQGHYLFLGRLITEKGIDTLLACWDQLRRVLGDSTPPLCICGAGPGMPRVAAAAASNPSIRAPGVVGGIEKDRLLEGCRALIVPSIWWEPLGLVVYEAYERAKPVLAAASGGLTETVVDGLTGWLHPPGDAGELAKHVIRLEKDGDLRLRMGQAGRRWLDMHAAPEKWLASFGDIAGKVADHPSE